MAPVSALAPLLKHAISLVEGAIVKAADESIIDDVQQLKSVAFAITSAGRHNRDLSTEERTAVWDVVSQIWVSLEAVAEPGQNVSILQHVQWLVVLPCCYMHSLYELVWTIGVGCVQNACVDAANAPYDAATKEAFLQMRQIARCGRQALSTAAACTPDTVQAHQQSASDIDATARHKTACLQ